MVLVVLHLNRTELSDGLCELLALKCIQLLGSNATAAPEHGPKHEHFLRLSMLMEGSKLSGTSIQLISFAEQAK